MHSYQMGLMAEEMRRDRLREAAHERLAREVRAAQVVRAEARGGTRRLGAWRQPRPGRAWLGRALASLSPVFRCPDGGPRWA